jgi:hypothetical protein
VGGREQESNGHVDLQGFLSMWIAACHLRTLESIEYLLYLGYAGGNLAAGDSVITVCGSRVADYKRRVTWRTVFEVLLCCAPGVDGAELALGMLARQREGGKPAPMGVMGSARMRNKQAGAAGAQVADFLVVDAVHTSRGGGGGGGLKAGRSEAGPDPLSPPPPVHLLVRPVSLEEGQLLLLDQRDLVDAGGAAGGQVPGAPRHRIRRKPRDCIDAVVLAFDVSDPASARACVTMREQMEKDELRMPCLMAGVLPQPPWSTEQPRHAEPTPANPASVDASLNGSGVALSGSTTAPGGVPPFLCMVSSMLCVCLSRATVS